MVDYKQISCGTALLTFLCNGCTVLVPNRIQSGTGPTTLLLPPGISTVKYNSNRALWLKRVYISTEPINTLAPSITISSDSSNMPARISKQGGQNYVTVPIHEFKCLEYIYHKSLFASRKNIPPSPINDLPFEIFFHGYTTHSDTIITSNQAMTFFFKTVVENITQENDCLSNNTKLQVIYLIRNQLSYVSDN